MKKLAILSIAILALVSWPVHAQAVLPQTALAVQFTINSCGPVGSDNAGKQCSWPAVISLAYADGIHADLIVQRIIYASPPAIYQFPSLNVPHDGRPAGERNPGTWHFLSEE
jgi:hypothetical protein